MGQEYELYEPNSYFAHVYNQFCQTPALSPSLAERCILMAATCVYKSAAVRLQDGRYFYG